MLDIRRLIRDISSPPPLRYRDFRFLWLSSVFNAIGFMGEMVVLGWVLLELTNSPFMVGVGMGMRMAPFFLFGIPAGAIAGLVDRRKLMIALGLALAGVTGTVSVIIIIDVLALWHLLIASFMVGSLWAMYQTSRQSFAYDIVGPSHLVSGFAFISLGDARRRHWGLAGRWIPPRPDRGRRVLPSDLGKLRPLESHPNLREAAKRNDA